MRALIRRLPYPIKQNLKRAYGALPLSLRYGKAFRDTYRFLLESQWWTRERLQEYQMEQLSRLLAHAYENVPYYRQLFAEYGLKPEDIQTFDDLRRLPSLQKDDFKRNIDMMVASNRDTRKLRVATTSGTSGKPLQFYWDWHEHQREWAFVCHQWSRVGYQPGEPRVELRGQVVQGKNTVYHDPVERVLRLSPRIDSKEQAVLYLDEIESFGARFLHGYPSAIGHLALMAHQYGLRIGFRLKAVLSASEPVYPWQREVIQQVFGCRIYSFYGMAEHVVMAGECENSATYHCVPQYGITEIDPVTDEIIGTSFLNYANPFIRYRTTDIASQPVGLGCSVCGRHYYPIFAAVAGRLDDYIVTPKGIPVSPAAITHPFKDLKTVRLSQLTQDSADRLVVRVVPWEPLNQGELEKEKSKLRRELQAILTPDMNIRVDLVDSIEVSESGKFKWIQSKVAKDMLREGLVPGCAPPKRD